ncbi:GmrSD restriction endonuclease domain-containing protein [Enterobacter cloacae complex sp. 405F3]|uniref:GmrSD restriction endonuclease domain-containing protein n=1 Tax=Enterobacter cloacae complex sp. 405F3 TaxID=3395853 RepID=UPI003CE95CA4
MQNHLNIRGEPIQSVYSEYRKGKYIVNRRYQRKLVWSLSEKQRFIDSLIKQYPVPLFLGVVFQHKEKGSCFEILDGMQRLEAITSFIDGKFSVDGKFFDLSVVAETNQLLISNELVQNEPKLEFDSCKSLLNYLLPISTSSYTSNEHVDETFRRINTGGVRLSTQEVRQAGKTCDFSQLVRRCSIYIRGDVSHSDIVELGKMRTISLTKSEADYGIKINDTFWNKHHIVTTGNVLASRDEELVAHILLCILLGNKSQTAANFLNDAYIQNAPTNIKANDAIAKHGIETLYKQFTFVYDEIKKVINDFPCIYSKHLYKNKPVGVSDSFQVVFLSFYDRLFKQNKKIQNYKSLANLMKGLASDCMSGLSNNKKWSSAERARMIRAVSGVLSPQFIAREGNDPLSQSWVENLENILSQSRTENVCYDFKIGFYPLNESNVFNTHLLSKIIKTLTAMANSHAGENYIVVGVADSVDDAKKHSTKYNATAKKCGDFYITGINDEANKYSTNIDKLQQKIKQSIEKEPINDATRRLILRNILLCKYYDKDVLILKIIRGKEPIKYDGSIYIRKMANTDPTPIHQDNEFEFFKEFLEQSSRYPYL